MKKLNIESVELKTHNDFYFESEDLEENECIINLCPQKIKKYWKIDNWYQRSPNVTSYKHDLPWDAEPRRLKSLVELANKNISIPPIDIHVSKKNGLSFPDGRHRSIVSIINQHKIIKAKVKISDKKQILNLLAH